MNDGLRDEIVENVLGRIAKVEYHVAVLIAGASVEVGDLHRRHPAQNVLESDVEESLRIEGGLYNVVLAINLTGLIDEWYVCRQDLVEPVTDRHFLRSGDRLAFDETW